MSVPCAKKSPGSDTVTMRRADSVRTKALISESLLAAHAWSCILRWVRSRSVSAERLPTADRFVTNAHRPVWVGTGGRGHDARAVSILPVHGSLPHGTGGAAEGVLMLEGISPVHIILILVIALIVVGPGKLPEVGGAIGKSIREFRKAASGQDDEPAAPAAPVPAPPIAPVAAPPAVPVAAPVQAAPQPAPAQPAAVPAPAPPAPPAPLPTEAPAAEAPAVAPGEPPTVPPAG